MTTSDVIAIDFGNLYSKVAIFKNGTEEILAYSDGHRSID
jgi:molecular chaperone DnaK (HSP70)